MLGFATIWLKLLTKSHEEGLAAYVATIGLPSVLFKSVAQLSFSKVHWPLVCSILLSKALLAILGVSLATLLTRSSDGTGFAFTLGGVVMLLSTMSDDVGIGIPVIQAFFGEKSAEVVALHLVILSALQSCLLNPFVFTLLGLGRARADQPLVAADADGASFSGGAGAGANDDFRDVLCGVLKGFRKNMMVISVVAGAAYNLAFDAAPMPWWLKRPVDTASQAFLPLVLVVAGMAMSSSIGHLTSLRLAVLPMMLVTIKSLLLPIISSYVYFQINDRLMGYLGSAPPHRQLHGPHESQRSIDLMQGDFVFLYGLLPVATSALAIAKSYRMHSQCRRRARLPNPSPRPASPPRPSHWPRRVDACQALGPSRRVCTYLWRHRRAAAASPCARGPPNALQP